MKLITITLTAVLLTGCGAAEVAAAPSGGGTTASPAGTSKAHAKHWVTVATLAGTGNKRGATFHLGGGDKQLVYTVKDTSGMGILTVGIYVVPKGKAIMKDGGFPEVMADQAGKDTTRLAQDAGDYYLDVSAANAKWSVKVREKK